MDAPFIRYDAFRRDDGYWTVIRTKIWLGDDCAMETFNMTPLLKMTFKEASGRATKLNESHD